MTARTAAPASRPRPIRVGGIDYLNALPLTRYLEEAGSPPLEISNHVPGVLAEKLRAGELDIALVPAVEYLAREDYQILPGISISSYGEVQSIRFYHRRPLSELRAVGLDGCSRTSSALTRLLFRDLWHGSPEFLQVSPREAIRVLEGIAVPGIYESLDGVLLIGDAALSTSPRDGWEALDLGTVWTRWTGLPFVYAFWAWRGGPCPPGVVERFTRARAEGLSRIDDIVRETVRPAGMDAAACRHYLHRVIQYDLDPVHVEGLLEFFRRIGSSLSILRGGASASAGHPPTLRWLEESPSPPA